MLCQQYVFQQVSKKKRESGVSGGEEERVELLELGLGEVAKLRSMQCIDMLIQR